MLYDENRDQTKVEKETEIVSNPLVYLDKFRNSQVYSEAFDKFKSGKTFTEEFPGEMQLAFEKLDNCRQTLIQFAKDGTMLEYEKTNYSETRVNNPIDDYFSVLKEHSIHSERFDAVSYDKYRGEYHDNATDFVYKKLNISRMLAVGIVQIMAIEKGLESFGLIEQDRIKSIARTL